MTPDRFVIRERIQELHDVFTLRLEPRDRQKAGEFMPGQFNMLYAFGGSEVPISFSGPDSDSSLWTHTIRSVGSATAALERLVVGDTVGVRGPYGRGWPMRAAKGKDLVVITGGLGMAPLRPVILNYLGGNSDIRSLRLYYGARSPEDILYIDEVFSWKKNFNVKVTVDHAAVGWEGNVGVVTSLLADAVSDPHETVAFLCGPEVMMRYTLQKLLAMQLTPSSIYLSMERNIKCATGTCGHCQWGPTFICRDGPVFSYKEAAKWLQIREL